MNINWHDVFALETSPLEIFIRGTLTYFGIFLMFRIILKREIGAMSINDLLVVVLVADAAQNGMAGDYHSISEGLLLVATLVFWSLTLDWLAFRFKSIENLIKPKPLPVIRHGRMLHRNLRREFISRQEMEAAAREQGIDDLSKIKAAYVEPDGRLSFIPEEKDAGESGHRGKDDKREV